MWYKKCILEEDKMITCCCVFMCVCVKERARQKEREKQREEGEMKRDYQTRPNPPATKRDHPEAVHPKPQPQSCSLPSWVNNPRTPRVVLWWQLHNNAGNCWWMCVVKCKRSDTQTVAAASCSGANDCLSLESLHFSVIKACQSQALVWLMIQIEIKYTAP